MPKCIECGKEVSYCLLGRCLLCLMPAEIPAERPSIHYPTPVAKDITDYKPEQLLYRVYTPVSDTYPPYVQPYAITKYTKCGYWLTPIGDTGFRWKPRWVTKNRRRPWAEPTEREAWAAHLQRKQWQHGQLTRKLSAIEREINVCNERIVE